MFLLFVFGMSLLLLLIFFCFLNCCLFVFAFGLCLFVVGFFVCFFICLFFEGGGGIRGWPYCFVCLFDCFVLLFFLCSFFVLFWFVCLFWCCCCFGKFPFFYIDFIHMYQGARCRYVIEGLLMMRWIVGLILQVGPFEQFFFVLARAPRLA